MSKLFAIHRLATYGTLAPGRSNHHELADLTGVWREGHVFGTLIASGWGAAEGYPGIHLDPSGDRVDVYILESVELPDHWKRLDAFEGAEYERVIVDVHSEQGIVQASVYALRPEPQE